MDQFISPETYSGLSKVLVCGSFLIMCDRAISQDFDRTCTSTALYRSSLGAIAHPRILPPVTWEMPVHQTNTVRRAELRGDQLKLILIGPRLFLPWWFKLSSPTAFILVCIVHSPARFLIVAVIPLVSKSVILGGCVELLALVQCGTCSMTLHMMPSWTSISFSRSRNRCELPDLLFLC